MLIKRIARLSLGIILYAIGIVFSINANLGVAPWDVFHQGITNISVLTFGQTSIIVGFILVIINYYLKEKVGFGTICNMIFIGLLIDIIFKYNLIPVSTHYLTGSLMIFLGMILISLATYFYIGAEFGIGPRDGLMVALRKKTGLSIGLIRGGIEIFVLIIGFILGGQIGIGTLIMAFSIGPIVQLTFKLLNFKVTEVKHDYLVFNKSA